jgi:hypothetical protein
MKQVTVVPAESAADLDAFKAATTLQLREPKPLSRDHRPSFVRPDSEFIPQPDDTTDNEYLALLAAFPVQVQRYRAADPFTGKAHTLSDEQYAAQFAHADVLNAVAQSHNATA